MNKDVAFSVGVQGLVFGFGAWLLCAGVYSGILGALLRRGRLTAVTAWLVTSAILTGILMTRITAATWTPGGVGFLIFGAGVFTAVPFGASTLGVARRNRRRPTAGPAGDVATGVLWFLPGIVLAVVVIAVPDIMQLFGT